MELSRFFGLGRKRGIDGVVRRIGLPLALVLLAAGCTGAQSTARFKAADFVGTQQMVAETLRANPKDEDALAMAGWSAFMLGNYRDAGESFRTLATQKPSNFDGALGQAWVAIKLGKLDEAEPHLANAARSAVVWQRPMVADAYGWLAIKRGDYKKAEGHFYEEDRIVRANSWMKPSASAAVGRGWIAMFKKDMATARHEFDDGLARDPACVHCYDGLARVALEQNRLPDALEAAVSGARRARHNYDLVGLLDVILGKVNKLDTSLGTYRTLAAVHDQDALYLNKIGYLLLAVNRPDDAKQAFQQALAREPKNPVALAGLGEKPAVPAAAAAAAPAAKAATTARYDLGWRHANAGRYREARLAFEQARGELPAASAWMADDGLAWVAFYQGNLPEAERGFRGVLAVAPDAALSLKGLGMVALARKDYAGAEPLLVRSFTLAAGQPLVSYTSAAAAFVGAGQDRAGEAVTDLGLTSHPQSADLHFLKAKLLARRQANGPAGEHLVKAATLAPAYIAPVFDTLKLPVDDTLCRAYPVLGWGLYFTGDNAGALKRFEAAARCGEAGADTARGRGFALFRLGRYQDALPDLQEAARSEGAGMKPVTENIAIPGSKRTWAVTYNAGSTIGWAYFRLGKHADAERAFRAATEAHPDWIDPWSGLGYALAAQGRKEDAVTAFKNALRIDPNYADAQAGMRGL